MERADSFEGFAPWRQPGDMIGVVIQALVLATALAAEPAAETPVASPAAELPSLPDEALVLALRRARISGQVGDRDGQRAQLDALVAAYPDDTTALAAGLAFHRDADGESDATRTLRGRLVDALGRSGPLIPLPLLQDVARDKKASDDELARVACSSRTRVRGPIGSRAFACGLPSSIAWADARKCLRRSRSSPCSTPTGSSR
jgi:hypothetical protein